MASSSTKMLAGVAVAVLAAAGVAAVVNYRLERRPDPQQRAYLAELDARLEVAERTRGGASSDHLGRVLDAMQRNQGVSARRLRDWIHGVRRGTLSTEQTTLAESDFDALERGADQGGV